MEEPTPPPSLFPSIPMYLHEIGRQRHAPDDALSYPHLACSEATLVIGNTGFTLCGCESDEWRINDLIAVLVSDS